MTKVRQLDPEPESRTTVCQLNNLTFIHSSMQSCIHYLTHLLILSIDKAFKVEESWVLGRLSPYPMKKHEVRNEN